MKVFYYMPSKYLILRCSFALGFLTLISSAFASSGDQWYTRGNDLVVKVNAEWVGMEQGGYHPVRMTIQNSGKACDLNIRFSSPNSSDPQPVVNQSIRVEQNETVSITLLVPLVTNGSYGKIDIIQNGNLLKHHTHQFSSADADYSTSEVPSLLVISPKKINFTSFHNVLNALALRSSSGSGHSHHFSGRHHSTLAEDRTLAIEPSMLPDNWLAYSGVDLVAVPVDTLAKMDRKSSTAILKWVQTGGTLIVYNVNEDVTSSTKLVDATLMKQNNHDSQHWNGLQKQNKKIIQQPTEDAFGNSIKKSRTNRFSWKAEISQVGFHPYLQGMVVAFQGDPFKGTLNDWGWLLSSLGKSRYSWKGRHGVLPRQSNSDFLSFLIPGVQGVPVFSFLLLITFFALVIGPINYIFLWKKKKLFLMVATIPLIALMTSLSLLGYSVVAHGWGVRSRTRSVTVLDQNSNTAVSTARIAFFSGMTPSNGLQFSPHTAVYPIWISENNFKSGTVNWTDYQSFQSGWLNSRTNTQFLLKEHRTERGRLNIKNSADGKLEIGNGLEWDISAIVVTDEAGNTFEGGELQKGASTQLNITNNLTKFITKTKQTPMEYPEGVTEGETFDPFGGNQRAYSYYSDEESAPTNAYSSSQMERSISHAQVLNKSLIRKKKQPRQYRKTYYAILKQNPGIGIGIEGTSERAGYHILIGYY